MLLSAYKKKHGANIQDMASDFGVTHQAIYQWIKQGATITGKKPNRVISINKTLRKEGDTKPLRVAREVAQEGE